jgi:membrane dipeptidase
MKTIHKTPRFSTRPGRVQHNVGTAPICLSVDSHLDTMQRALFETIDLGTRLESGHVDLIRMREGGLNLAFFALWVPPYYRGADAVRRTLDIRDAAQCFLDSHFDQVELANDAVEIDRVIAAGKLAAIFTLEGGHQIDNDLAVLRMYHRLGFRSMTLTHICNNDWADSSTDQPVHGGLAEFGKDVVREMNRLGMLVDLSHVSDRTFFDAVAASSQPVILSHSSCREISPIPRNASDEMLRTLAANGGVIGINLGSGFLNQTDAAEFMAALSQLREADPIASGWGLDEYSRTEHCRDTLKTPAQTAATIDDAVTHIDHVARVAGIDHVGIGSDFDGGIDPPEGLKDISMRPALVAALHRKGYGDADLGKIMGENFGRVIKAAVK